MLGGVRESGRRGCLLYILEAGRKGMISSMIGRCNGLVGKIFLVVNYKEQISFACHGKVAHQSVISGEGGDFLNPRYVKVCICICIGTILLSHHCCNQLDAWDKI